MNSKLWLPLDVRSKIKKDINSEVKQVRSWFSVTKRVNQDNNTHKIYPDELTTPCVHTAEIIITKKIRIKPNKTQQRFLKEWLGSARQAYNYTISKSAEHFKLNEETSLNLQAFGLCRAKDIVRESYPFPSWMTLKRKDNTDFWRTRESWLKPIPSKCFTQAFKHACDARKAGFKKGGMFELKFRSRKDKIQSCFIPKNAVKQDSIFSQKMKSVTGTSYIKFTEKLPENFLDCELVLDHGEWYLCVPYKKKLRPVESQNRVVALDVGIRKFLTYYSEDSCGFIGKNVTDRLFRLSKALDDLVSNITKVTGKLKKILKNKADRLRVKIKNLVKELHYKTCNFLINNFDVVLLPHYKVSDFVIKSGRKLNNKTVRNMLSLNFYKFSQILIRKFNEKKGSLIIGNKLFSRVIRVNEAYTSKTQTWNGKIVPVGSKEVLHISKNVTIDRDINGARNIFLRALVDSPSLRSLTL